MKIDENLFQIALTYLEGIGPRYAKILLNHFGSAQGLFDAHPSDHIRLNGVGNRYSSALQRNRTYVLEKAHQVYEYAQKNSINIINKESPDYPYRLKQCDDAPLVLFTKGNGRLNMDYMISIVGTRNATSYGKALTRQFVEEITAYNVGVVSGLAYGIDIEAHMACLRCQVPTFGVLAHGLDRIYPASHGAVSEQIKDNGLLITEFGQGVTADRENFPKRNRIVAGLCDATIVVESGLKGGSLITAYLANDYNREVFAFPSRVGDPQGKGCNHLIKVERARLIESVDDLAYLMNWQAKNLRTKASKQVELLLTEEEEKVLELLLHKAPLHRDALNAQLAMKHGELSACLLALEFNGLIKPIAGNFYQRI